MKRPTATPTTLDENEEVLANLTEIRAHVVWAGLDARTPEAILEMIKELADEAIKIITHA